MDDVQPGAVALPPTVELMPPVQQGNAGNLQDPRVLLPVDLTYEAGKPFSDDRINGLTLHELRWLRYELYAANSYPDLRANWLQSFTLEKYGTTLKREESLRLSRTERANETKLLEAEARAETREVERLDLPVNTMRMANEIQYSWNAPLVKVYGQLRDLEPLESAQWPHKPGVFKPELSLRLSGEQWRQARKSPDGLRQVDDPEIRELQRLYVGVQRTVRSPALQYIAEIPCVASVCDPDQADFFHLYGLDGRLLRTSIAGGDRLIDVDVYYQDGRPSRFVVKTKKNAMLESLAAYEISSSQDSP